ncbi:MAG: hypothetical protein ACHREM_04720 [Polyangiales bacterium]
MFPTGSLVRITRQPGNQVHQIAGEVGFVEEVQQDDLRYVQTMRDDGGMGGAGSVPISCLADASGDADVVQRKQRYDAQRAAYRSGYDAWHARYKAGVKAIAAKHKLPVSVVEDIYGEVSELYP